MNLKPMIYVAGPISTGGDIPGNAHHGIVTAEALRKIGFVTFSPHLSVLTEIVCGSASWEGWLEYDEQIILRCDALFRMEGDSRGGDREEAFAQQVGIPVFKDVADLVAWRADWERGRGMEKACLDALQREVGEWGDKTFPVSTVSSVLAHFQKEVKELVEAYSNGQADPSEIADCQLLLIHLAHKTGASIRDEVRRKFEINKARKWGKPDAQGVVEHVRE